ncbi:YtxH domain-containing protein [Adhaeribacter soli]|uniref:YtxH domain-containing protein n=1 Tax=Adhaeribacter soli TaxID=2607655 RepID=A0A5N1ILV8_9BACT|nr:YtxH domain-containing protein [Adhaeribacter soli]KAA9327338.1 YtxH domain-containing protein [Adhaeribacter soli]
MRDNSGKIILALLAGASAGVIAGLLMAPDSGTATRDTLKKSASKLGKDLEKKLQDAMSKMEGMNAGALIDSASSMLGMNKGDGQGSTGSTTGGAGNRSGSTSGGASTTGGGSTTAGTGSGMGGNAGGAGSAGGGATS